MPESTDLKSGGDREERPETLLNTTYESNSITFLHLITKGPTVCLFMCSMAITM
jgi:hypothetical protein